MNCLGSAVGGYDMYTVTDRLREGCHILSATTGRLKDMVEKGRVNFQSISNIKLLHFSSQISLKQVKYFVLDEADRYVKIKIFLAIEMNLFFFLQHAGYWL